jgi:hypothetical protein
MEDEKPFLVYTRKQGWIVVKPAIKPSRPGEHGVCGYGRPGAAKIWNSDVLARHPLPPVPDEAL